MEYKWIINSDYNQESVETLSTELGVPPLLARVLMKRGITSFDQARWFFRPDLEQLHDPYLMKDMDVAVDRVHHALQRGEKILVYGDYDVDGVTGASILYMVLSRLVGSKVSYYIPIRISEGYGLSKAAIKEQADLGVSLIITVDCGVTAVEEIAYAGELGVDVVVCDHHQAGEELPPAVAILDPKRPDCNYPFKELAGVGVGFKFLQGLYRKLELPEAELDEFLDIVAIGSAADIVPLVDENRILVRHGLDRINSNPRYGVKALLEAAGLQKRNITVGLIVFVVAPRINAVGRMGDAKRGVQLFMAKSLQKARTLARELEKENQVRRNVDETTFKEALEIVDAHLNADKEAAFVLYKDDWHPGVIGIVASRIVERFYRPTVMISVTDGVGKGSARSISNFNIYEAIKECSEFLTAFGGHKYAAGLTIPRENIPAFVERFKSVADSKITREDLVPSVKVDCEAKLADFDKRFIRLLKLMGPFGPMNLPPVFVSRKVNIVGTPMIVGNNHLKLRVEQGGAEINAIGFHLGDHLDLVQNHNRQVDCAYVVEENEWNGRKEIQLRLKDLK